MQCGMHIMITHRSICVCEVYLWWKHTRTATWMMDGERRLRSVLERNYRSSLPACVRDYCVRGVSYCVAARIVLDAGLVANTSAVACPTKMRAQMPSPDAQRKASCAHPSGKQARNKRAQVQSKYTGKNRVDQ